VAKEKSKGAWRKKGKFKIRPTKRSRRAVGGGGQTGTAWAPQEMVTNTLSVTQGGNQKEDAKKGEEPCGHGNSVPEGRRKPNHANWVQAARTKEGKGTVFQERDWKNTVKQRIRSTPSKREQVQRTGEKRGGKKREQSTGIKKNLAGVPRQGGILKNQKGPERKRKRKKKKIDEKKQGNRARRQPPPIDAAKLTASNPKTSKKGGGQT